VGDAQFFQQPTEAGVEDCEALATTRLDAAHRQTKFSRARWRR
jgi:hypothetical protein